MSGRSCVGIIAIIFALVTLITGLIAFLSSWNKTLSQVYFMSLDLSKINVSGVSASSIVEDAGVHLYYQVGVNGYCYGSESGNITDCASPSTPFWFDLVGILGNSSSTASSIVKELPSQVSQYDTALKAASYTMWGCFVAVVLLSAAMVILGALSLCSPIIGCCLSLISSLCFLLALIAAGIATGMFKVYSSKFNETASSFGASASMGNSGLAAAWACVGAALLTQILWAFRSCCLRYGPSPVAPAMSSGYAPVEPLHAPEPYHGSRGDQRFDYYEEPAAAYNKH